MKRVKTGTNIPTFEDDSLRGISRVCINGVFYDEVSPLDEEHERAKSEAITEQAEELELVKGELRAYRAALRNMTPKAQLRAALEVVGVDDRDAERVIESWSRIQNL